MKAAVSLLLASTAKRPRFSRRVRLIIVLACIAAALPIACSRTSEPQTSVSASNATGASNKTPSHPLRIVSLCSAATDAVIQFGAADRLVGVDQYSRIAPGADKIPVVGKGSAVSKETIAALRPNLAFVWYYQNDVAAMFEELGVPTIRIRVARVAELPDTLRLIGESLDCRDQANRAAERIQKFLDSHKATSAVAGAPIKPRVFLEMYGPFKTMGRNTYVDDLLNLAGAENVAAEAEGSVILSAEKLVQSDPGVILRLKDLGDAKIAERPGIDSLLAVRQNHIYDVDRYYLTAGPSLPESVEKLRAVIARAVSNN